MMSITLTASGENDINARCIKLLMSTADGVSVKDTGRFLRSVIT